MMETDPALLLRQKQLRATQKSISNKSHAIQPTMHSRMYEQMQKDTLLHYPSINKIQMKHNR